MVPHSQNGTASSAREQLARVNAAGVPAGTDVCLALPAVFLADAAANAGCVLVAAENVSDRNGFVD
jgi:hypothetical protein